MRHLFLIFTSTAVIFLSSCGGKSSKDNKASETDTLTQHDNAVTTPVSTALPASVKPALDKELSSWAQSFKGFTIDSFRLTQNGGMEQVEYQSIDGLKSFYALYKPSLIFSPDSSQFIDLVSAGVSLERKGKKLIAISDVDQAVTLCNLKTKEWKRIAFFGPSAGIEEAAWISPTQFVLAGFMHNDDGKSVPILLLGDLNDKSLRWYEAGTARPESVNYTSSGIKNLKIDEWE